MGAASGAPSEVVSHEAPDLPPEPRSRGQLHPLLIVLAILLATILLTHLIPAGRFHRVGGQVVPGTYRAVPKTNGLQALVARTAPVATSVPAHAAGVVALFADIPAGMSKSANLIFMVMFVGGTFGILRATGAIDAGIDRLLHLTSGNAYMLTGGLMVLLSCGSTFLGFSSEYIAIIPVVMALGRKLRLPNLFAPAVVALSDFIGYTASVTNPIALGVAQPLAGVAVFSGMLPRLEIFIVLLALGLGYVLLYLRRLPKVSHTPVAANLTPRQVGVLMSLVVGGAALVAGTGLWSWESPQLSAAFIALGLLLAWVGGLRPGAAADAFLEGMKSMVLAALLIGLAGSTAVILQSSEVLDSIVQGIAGLIQGGGRGAVAAGLMTSEMAFSVLMPSVSGKAAVSMPILAPIAHLSGVGGQVTVAALLLGSGLTNMISPTNTLLLAFLSASNVGYLQWVRFVAPLFAIFCVTCFVALILVATVAV